MALVKRLCIYVGLALVLTACGTYSGGSCITPQDVARNPEQYQFERLCPKGSTPVLTYRSNCLQEEISCASRQQLKDAIRDQRTGSRIGAH